MTYFRVKNGCKIIVIYRGKGGPKRGSKMAFSGTRFTPPESGVYLLPLYVEKAGEWGTHQVRTLGKCHYVTLILYRGLGGGQKEGVRDPKKGGKK